MNVRVCENYEEMSRKVAEHIINYINNKPDSLLCLAGGDTPLQTYKFLVEAANKNEVNLKKCKFVSLDEWVGLGIDVKGSCIETLYNQLYNKLPIDKEKQICFFNGLAENLDGECRRIDSFILQNGGLDICLLGIGMNGHLGFNEPGVDPNLLSTVVPLDPVTKKVSVKYFNEEVKISAGITLGMKHITNSKEIILIANDQKKADIVKATIEGEETVMVPSSLVNNRCNSYIYLDEDAASKLNK